MSDTPRMDAMLQTALQFLNATPHNGDITEQHIVAIGVILSQIGELGKTLERELAAVTKERDLANVVLACLCDMVLGEDTKDASNDALMHGVRKLLNERDSAIKDLRETHNAYLEEMHGASFRADQYKEERDESNQMLLGVRVRLHELEKQQTDRDDYDRIMQERDEARAALREAMNAMIGTLSNGKFPESWRKAAGLEDAQ